MTTQKSQQESLKILGKGMFTLPKSWRNELGLTEGSIVKAQKKEDKLLLSLYVDQLPTECIVKMN